MKVFVGVMLFFLLFFAVGWYTEVMITNQAAAILDQLEKLATYVKAAEMKEIDDQLEIINHLWVKARNYWVLLIDHHDLDHFEVALARTKAFIDNNAPVFALSEIAELKQIIYRIPDELDLTWENIF
jgi:flagellar motor component MotA